MPKATGGQPYQNATGSELEPVDRRVREADVKRELVPLTLAELGLDKKTSSIAQKLASLPAEQLRPKIGGYPQAGRNSSVGNEGRAVRLVARGMAVLSGASFLAVCRQCAKRKTG